MKIYLDFDGTVVEHEWPKIGRCNYGCFEVIKKLQDAGHEIILNTSRAESYDKTLNEALEYINDKAWMFVESYDKTLNEALEYINDKAWMFVNRSLRDNFKLNPIIASRVKLNSPDWNWFMIEASQEMYIDDQAINTPLKPACMNKSMMVDWDELNRQFIEHKIY
jgi:hypothetical protein